jgi:starvation-inducible DNA-binding protein
LKKRTKKLPCLGVFLPGFSTSGSKSLFASFSSEKQVLSETLLRQERSDGLTIGANPMSKTSHSSPAPALAVPSDLAAEATRDIAGAVNGLLADVFALYLKTKNFHWHMSGPHFRDYHLMLDEQSDQIFAMTDVLAERVRKLGRLTLHSIGEISRMQRISDNDAPFVTPQDALAELREDNAMLAKRMREAHGMIDDHDDVATASLLENFIDETERRAWFLYEASHHASNAS